MTSGLHSNMIESLHPTVTSFMPQLHKPERCVYAEYKSPVCQHVAQRWGKERKKEKRQQKTIFPMQSHCGSPNIDLQRVLIWYLGVLGVFSPWVTVLYHVINKTCHWKSKLFVINSTGIRFENWTKPPCRCYLLLFCLSSLLSLSDVPAESTSISLSLMCVAAQRVGGELV